MQKEETQMHKWKHHYHIFFPFILTNADRYTHLQLSSLTLPAGYILKPCFFSIHFNITLSFMHRSKLLNIQASDTEITACQYNDCKV